MVTALCGGIGVTYFNVRSNQPGTYNASLSTGFRVSTEVWFWGSCLTDILNTASLCTLLRTKVVGFNSRTDGVLKSVMKLAVETASYTAFVALIAAITSAATDPLSPYSGDIIYTFWLPLPSLYCLSLFRTLAARDQLRKDISCSPPLVTRNSSRGRQSARPTRSPNGHLPSSDLGSNYLNVLIDVTVSQQVTSEAEKTSTTAKGYPI